MRCKRLNGKFVCHTHLTDAQNDLKIPGTMANSKLQQLINTFSPVEQREVRKFLLSPYFNTRQDLTALYELWATQPAADKEAGWAAACPGQAYDDQKMRLLMSYLLKLLERYISIREAEANESAMQLHLAAGYRRRGLTEAFERVGDTARRALETQPHRDIGYYQQRYQLLWEEYQAAMIEKPTEVDQPLRQLAEMADVAYLAARLRLICLSAAQRGVYRAEEGSPQDEQIVALAESHTWRELPAIAIYLNCYRMLRLPEEEVHFQGFKDELLRHGALFVHEDVRGLYLLAINYGIRQINNGRKQYSAEVLDLYKAGLANGALLENAALSRFTFHNIVAAGLQSGELDWVERFIYQWQSRIERPYRESSFSFNLARLEYARKHYPAVLSLLQHANYRDPLLNLAAKTLLLKTWYELGEWDLLQSHLDAMRSYIRRKRVIGYHRSNYLNVLRYAQKLINLNANDKEAVHRLAAAIAKEETLSEREWLLQCVVGVY